MRKSAVMIQREALHDPFASTAKSAEDETCESGQDRESDCLGLGGAQGAGVVKTERALVGPALYCCIKALGYQATKEHTVSRPNLGRPKQVDFRIGGNNPVLIELAVRPPHGAQELAGPQNKTELRKLARARQAQVRTRFLLLIDLRSGEPIKKSSLRKTYDPIHAGVGKFERAPVRVVYVSKSTHYDFPWDPFA